MTVVFLGQKEMDERGGVARAMGAAEVVLWDGQSEDLIREATSIVVGGKKETEASRRAGKIMTSSRSLLPAKETSLIMALLYNDRNKLIRKVRGGGGSMTQPSQAPPPIIDTQTTNRSGNESQFETLMIGETQNTMTIMTCTGAGRVNWRSDSFVEPSANLIPLDKSISPAASSKGGKSFIEPTMQPPRLDKTINTPSSSKIGTSFIEPTVQPPRLDKTINSPACPKMGTSFIEPTVQPPRLDKTLDTPNRTKSFIEPTVQPPRLDKTLVTPGKQEPPSPITPANMSSASLFSTTTTSRISTTPATVTPSSSFTSRVPSGSVRPPQNSGSISHSRAVPATSGSASLFSGTTSSRIPKSGNSRLPKRVYPDDSDDDDYNPFAATLRPLNIPSFQETLDSAMAAKRARMNEPEDEPPEPIEPVEHVVLPVVPEPVQPVEPVKEEVKQEVVDVEEEVILVQSGYPTTSTEPSTPRVKRELEPVSASSGISPSGKRAKLERSIDGKQAKLEQSIGMIKILSIHESSSNSQWIRNVRKTQTSENGDDTKSCVAISPNLLARSMVGPSRTTTQDVSRSTTQNSSGLVNYKGFKRKHIPTRSINITLSVGSFGETDGGHSRLLASDDESDNNQSDGENSFNPFFDAYTKQNKTQGKSQRKTQRTLSSF
eukprot:sb/3462798/